MRRLRMLAIVLPALAACKGSSESPSHAVVPLTVTAAVETGAVSLANGRTGAKADGASTVRITVSGATSGPIALSTTGGTFSNGSDRISLELSSPTTVLTACDARVDATCAGSVNVTAQAKDLATGSVPVRFVGFERACDNNVDDNGNGQTDCADADCDTRDCKTAAGEAGTCTSGACVATGPTGPTGPSGPTGPTGPGACTPSASTNICLDSACEEALCQTGSVNHRCRSGVCVDTGTPWALTVTTARARLPANGSATTTITVKALQGVTANAGVEITLSTDLGAFLTASGPASSVVLTTGANGMATATYRASAEAGTATINATIAGTTPTTQSVLVTMPALGSIVLPAGGIQNPVMGVKYSGWNEQNHIVVALLDTDQKPYPDGLAVRFEHQRLGGSTVSVPLAPDTATCVAANNCIAYIGQTASPTTPDKGGLASVNLYSGTTAGLASFVATATAGGITRTLTIQGIGIVGAKASGAHISIDCSPKNLPVLAYEHDCINSLTAMYDGIPATVTCTARFADRFNNVLGTSLLTTFASEAGAAGAPIHTAAFDPAKAGKDQTSDLGFATDTIAVAGYALPRDVPIVVGEPSTTIAGGDSCTAPLDKVHNPRDGLSTIIAMAKGEEGFVDLNGNGTWDTGEPFIDLGEPYVDADDNGTHDAGEYFVDLNGNGRYDGPNGVWDADTTIWTETRVLYTGKPDPALTYTSPASLVFALPRSGTDEPVTFGFLDANHNPLSPAVTSYTLGAVSDSTLVTNGIFRRPNIVDGLGMTFSLRYCNRPAGSTTAPTVCGSVCTTSPCYVVPGVSGFALADKGEASVFVPGYAIQDTALVTPVINWRGLGILGEPARIPIVVQ